MALSAYLGKPKSIAEIAASLCRLLSPEEPALEGNIRRRGPPIGWRADLNTMLIAACVVKCCCSALCELS